MEGQDRMDPVTLNKLVSNELANQYVQKIDINTYKLVSELISRIRNEEYDGIEAKMKSSLLSMVTELATLLVEARMSKLPNPDTPDYKYLLNEEKRVLDFEDEAYSARSAVLSAVLDGKPKILETISERHKKKMALVVLRENTDAQIGADLREYGPYAEYDVACLPLENAVALESKGSATKLRWADFVHSS